MDDRDGVRIITIRRPQVANSLGGGTCNEILTELKKGASDPSVKGFVITGYGTKAFCAGADIGGFIATIDNHTAGVELARGNSEVLHFMDTMEKPVVAAVNGLAMGGGVEVALRCHSLVADRDAFFQLPEITLGILPGMGGAVVPYRKWPHASATFNANAFGRGNLYMMNIIPVPQRFEDPVGKPCNHYILNRLLSQIMIYTVNLVLCKTIEQMLV